MLIINFKSHGEHVADIVSGGRYIVNDKCLHNMKEIQEEFDCVFKIVISLEKLFSNFIGAMLVFLSLLRKET